MAPMTRNMQPAGGIGKKVHRKRPTTQRTPSDSWALFGHQDLNPNAGDGPMDQPEEDRAPVTSGSADIDAAVEPLREVADRVGNKVEDFAILLDTFLTELPTVANKFDAVHDLVSKFKDTANKVVSDLKKTHELELRDYMKREWSEQARISTASTAQKSLGSTASSSIGTRRAEQIKELRQWQQEADIWDLFRLMLELHPFESDAQTLRAEREEELTKLGPPHRYTSERELWKRFILEDDVARERYAIKSWLERTAEHQQSDMQGVLEVLEAKAGKGKGLWSSGWMDTREKIKAQKLIRNWPSDADAPLPQIRRTDNNELVVTTLDPDAPARQKRTLEKPDVYFERAMWIACWEMLRRGMDWDEVCAWCEERKEGWRAVCLGAARDEADPSSSNAGWRRVCELASRAPNSNEYETAVLGLLGGNSKAMEKVCRSVDDHLYAFYSSNLLQQFDQYLLITCPKKATPDAWRYGAQNGLSKDIAENIEQAEQAINELIQRLRQGPATSNESAQPMKIIQSYLLADEVGSLIHTVGAAVVETARLHGNEDALFLRGEDVAANAVSLPELEVALNPQTLRIAAHMAIMFGILNPHLPGDELSEDQNVLVAYIQALRVAGKRDTIPLYASRLQRDRSIAVLSRTLQDVTPEKDQSDFLSIIREFDLDIVAIMTEQLNVVMAKPMRGESVGGPLRILERTEETKLHPGRRIMVNFLPEGYSQEDKAVVSSLSWFQLIPGGWKVTFDALSLAVRKCLVTGRFACARLIVNEFPYDEVSVRKSYDIIGRSINIMSEESPPHNEQEAMTRELMKRQSQTYFELQQLITAIETLAAWRIEEHTYVSKTPKPSSIPASLKLARSDVSTAMVPIEKGILLQPADEEEAKDLEYIRNTYIPEVVLAYITVLHAAGNLISRENLLDAMDLANFIAESRNDNGDSNGLEECFVKAGRMRELMECFALTSKVMLVLKAEGRVWSLKKGDRVGRDLGMWESGMQVGGEE